MKKKLNEITDNDIIGTWGGNNNNYELTFRKNNIYHFKNNITNEQSNDGNFSTKYNAKDNVLDIHLDKNNFEVIIFMLHNEEIILKVNKSILYKI